MASTGRSVDAIAINAGDGVRGDFARDTDRDAELNIISLNVVSTVQLAKRVVAAGSAARRARAVHLIHRRPDAAPFEAVYAASKAFVEPFAKALRNEWKDTGVTVTLPNRLRHRAGDG